MCIRLKADKTQERHFPVHGLQELICWNIITMSGLPPAPWETLQKNQVMDIPASCNALQLAMELAQPRSPNGERHLSSLVIVPPLLGVVVEYGLGISSSFFHRDHCFGWNRYETRIDLIAIRV
jgi:hypothetical protein